jgi:hypothetical protein
MPLLLELHGHTLPAVAAILLDFEFLPANPFGILFMQPHAAHTFPGNGAEHCKYCAFTTWHSCHTLLAKSQEGKPHKDDREAENLQENGSLGKYFTGSEDREEAVAKESKAHRHKRLDIGGYGDLRKRAGTVGKRSEVFSKEETDDDHDIETRESAISQALRIPDFRSE